MLRTLTAIACFAACVALVWLPIDAYQTGPPPATTGGFGEDTCSLCHDTYEPNAGRALGLGDLVLAGFPEEYEVGATYRISVEVAHTQGRGAWGFQLATRTREAGEQAGDLRPLDRRTSVVSQNSIQYIGHTAEGTFFNVYEFEWVAPGVLLGDVVVHVAGSAADGDASEFGDYIYTSSIILHPIHPAGGIHGRVPAPDAPWGE